MTPMIPSLRTSAKVWQVLGGALYRARPLLGVTLRELYQNSRDACRGLDCTPEIAITLETDDFKFGTLTCEDNGCGMSEETLLTKFLVLGESEKAAGSAGGWGIEGDYCWRRLHLATVDQRVVSVVRSPGGKPGD